MAAKYNKKSQGRLQGDYTKPKGGNNNDIDQKDDQDFLREIKPLLNLSSVTIAQIKTGVESIQKLIEEGRNGRKPISTGQLRNIYKLVRDASSKGEGPLNLIRPKLAYISARQEGEHGRKIARVIDGLLKEANAENKEGLNYILEAMVAYHKFHIGE